ncbi:MAG: hypothetical protein KBD78_06460 [Oligoflexales bacterium]|nr:hypothetical protein [Oligoflexales bacterium]
MKVNKIVASSIVTLIYGIIFCLLSPSNLWAVTPQTNASQELNTINVSNQTPNANNLFLQYQVNTRVLQTRSHSEVVFKKMNLLAEKKLGSASTPHDLQATLSVILQELSGQP